jgi:NtrC-family two-component system sensor histidine kinase KinB
MSLPDTQYNPVLRRCIRLWWSLAGRIWLTNLVLLLLMAALVALAISRLGILESSVNRVLSRNYQSIQAANGMMRAVSTFAGGESKPEKSRQLFDRWLEVEKTNVTEPGEGRLAARVELLGTALFANPQLASPAARRAREDLMRSLQDLIVINEHAMFSADRETINVARRLRAWELTIAIVAVSILMVLGLVFARTLAIAPLAALTAQIRRINNEQSLKAMPTPKTAELAQLAGEFNKMVIRLQQDYQGRLFELDRERSKTAAIIESVEDGLIVLDPADAVVHINEVACAILDLDPAGTRGAKLDSLSRTNRRVEQLVDSLSRQRPPGVPLTELTVFVRGRDHTYLARELPWTGTAEETLGRIVALQDVTMIRDQERARSNLIATLSHELKTPLTSLTMGSELLCESMKDETDGHKREILSIVLDDVQRLKKISSDLLDASRTGAARIEVHRQPLVLNRIVREVARPFEMQAHEKGITFEIRGDETSIAIEGDSLKLPWVISNLVGNALRYTASGGRISIALARNGSRAMIEVADTGAGIAAEAIGRIFEPFTQLADGRYPMGSERTGSAGLGLYIAKEIVEAHRGRIHVRSEPGVGTSFIVELPLSEEARLG